MNSESISLLKAIDEKLEQINSNENEIKESLATILMAIYDLDTTPTTYQDNGDIITGIKAICNLLQKIINNQYPTNSIIKDNEKQ